MNVREKPLQPSNLRQQKTFIVSGLNLQQINERIRAKGLEPEYVNFVFDEEDILVEYYELEYSLSEWQRIWEEYERELEQYNNWLDEHREVILKAIKKEEEAETTKAIKNLYEVKKKYATLKNQYTK